MACFVIKQTLLPAEHAMQCVAATNGIRVCYGIFQLYDQDAKTAITFMLDASLGGVGWAAARDSVETAA